MTNSATANKGKPDSTVIRGEVLRIRYQKADENFVIFELKQTGVLQRTVVVGTGSELRPGMEVIVTGYETTHQKFGDQFKALNISIVEPTSRDGIIRYLSSGLIPGIGEGLAQRIVKKFGDETLEILKADPYRLQEVSGIGKQKAGSISSYLEENSSLHEITRFLSEHNISPHFAHRIYKKYGNDSIQRLKRNPYLLAKEMRGVGFATADSIALRLGIELHSAERQKAGLLYALEKSRDDGHCYYPTETLISAAGNLLGFPLEPGLTTHLLRELEDDGDIVIDDEKIYTSSLYHAETWLAEFASERCTPWEKPIISERAAEGTLRTVEREMNLTFSAEQRSAVFAAVKYPLLVLTGGPGCGKTTVTRAIVETFEQAGKTIALTAPTGRAAQRLSHVCNQPAKTIHRLLRYDPFNNSFFYGPNNPLILDEKHIDVLIVDESSMIDLSLAKDLLSALSRKTAVILVGDRDQLPSVGPGTVFGDLLSVSKMPTVTLSQLYRREGSSTINDVAYQVNAGIEPSIPEPDGVTKADAYFIKRNEAEEAGITVEKLVSEQIPKKFGIPSDKITVLTPSNRGPLGTIALNKRLQNVLNPHDESGGIPITGSELKIFPNDRVCQRKNNYQIDENGVFNGDTGIVQEVDSDAGTATVELWDGRLIHYEGKDLSQLMLAYAITVHRSQGTEVPCVVLTLHESHYTLLERQLIYTAVTRAKELLVVVGSKRALFLGTKRSSSKKRFSALTDRLQKLVK